MNAVTAHKHDLSTHALDAEKSSYKHLSSYYDEKYKINWLYMHASPRACFSNALLDEITDFTDNMKSEMLECNHEKYDYLVVSSKVENVFNLGGDLDLFTHLINSGDRQGLLEYAIKGINLVYNNHRHFDLEMTTISLIQGDALGGGLEAALSSNVIIAEKGAKLGLPEVLFNLFPGMGAYSIISRKVSSKLADEMILSGKIFSSDELYELGLVDILVEKGQGELAVYKYIQSTQRAANTVQAMRQVKDICDNLSYEEMIKIAEVWADAALKISSRDLRMMHRLIKRQSGVSRQKPVMPSQLGESPIIV